MAENIGDPNTLLQPEIMAAPITWLASALTPTQAVQAGSAPAAWAGYGDKSIRPQ